MEEKLIKLSAPLSDEDVSTFKAGTRVLIEGTLYTARDAAHKRLVDLIEAGKELPVDLSGAIIYYVGPTPPPPGKPLGSAGPTTSYRMDSYAPRLIEAAVLKAMIGKGGRSGEVIEACKKHKAVYLAATGGAGALLGGLVEKAEVVAYSDLGPEAIRKLTVRNFPAVVVNDITGADLYKIGREKYGEPLENILARL